MHASFKPEGSHERSRPAARSGLHFSPFLVLFGLYALMGFSDATLGVSWHTLLQAHNTSSSQLAAALFAGTLAALPLFWFGGRWLERRDRRPALLLALLLLLTSSSLAFFAASSGALLLAALLVVPSIALLELGASGQALEGQASPSGKRGVPLGRVQSGFAAGAVLGAVLGGWLSGSGHLGWASLPMVLGALLLARGIAGLRGASRCARRCSSLESLRAPLRWGSPTPMLPSGAPAGLLLPLALLAVIVAYSEGLMLSWSGLFLERELGFSAAHSGVLSSGYHLAFGLGAFVSSSLLARFGARTTLGALAALSGVGALGLALASGALLAAPAMLLLGFALAGMLPTLTEWIGTQVGARAAGFVGTFAYTGMLLEPLGAGLLGEHLRPLFATIPLLLLLAALWLVLPRLEGVRLAARGSLVRTPQEVHAAYD